MVTTHEIGIDDGRRDQSWLQWTLCVILRNQKPDKHSTSSIKITITAHEYLFQVGTFVMRTGYK